MRTARFMAAWVVAIVEYPNEDGADQESSSRRGRDPDPNAEILDFDRS